MQQNEKIGAIEDSIRAFQPATRNFYEKLDEIFCLLFVDVNDITVGVCAFKKTLVRMRRITSGRYANLHVLDVRNFFTKVCFRSNVIFWTDENEKREKKKIIYTFPHFRR